MRRAVIVMGAAVMSILSACDAPRALPSVRAAGDRAFNAGDYQEAAKHYEEFVLRKPGDAAVENDYAVTLIKVGQPAKAIEHATIAYDQQPNNPVFADTLGEAYFQAGKTEQLTRWLRGNTEGRGSVADYIRQGKFAARMGDADGAELSLLTAAKLDQGKTVAPQLALAELYKSLGDKKSEVKRLRMALYLEPNSLEIGKRLRELGEIPGPTLALPPAER